MRSLDDPSSSDLDLGGPAETHVVVVLAKGAAGSGEQRGEETVLLVEDDAAIRAMSAGILELHGYSVLQARNGRDAINVAARYDGEIDLLLTDVVMPEMGGKQLSEAMLARDPALRVLFVSGFSDAGGPPAQDGSSPAFLHKPFSLHALLERVREVLDAGTTAT